MKTKIASIAFLLTLVQNANAVELTIDDGFTKGTTTLASGKVSAVRSGFDGDLNIEASDDTTVISCNVSKNSQQPTVNDLYNLVVNAIVSENVSGRHSGMKIHCLSYDILIPDSKNHSVIEARSPAVSISFDKGWTHLDSDAINSYKVTVDDLAKAKAEAANAKKAK
jgi:L-asparaginase II